MPGKAGQGGRGVRIRIAGVDHDRQARRRRDLELAIEELDAGRARCEVVEVVEARLADRHGPRVTEQLDELVHPRSLRPGRLVRIDPERREHALLGFCDRERRVAGRDPGADRDDARDADRPGPFDEERGGLVAAVEVGVGVDHRGPTTPRAARGEGRAAARPRSRASRQ